tara:strand:+ start:415 stop:648 length:234 start_codon:yes stop_codon:yes gene_type:complete
MINLEKMKTLKNLKEWKTTLIGIVCYVVSFYYLLEVENHNMWVFTILLIFATLMLFSADSLISSLTKFIKNNEDKKI